MNWKITSNREKENVVLKDGTVEQWSGVNSEILLVGDVDVQNIIEKALSSGREEVVRTIYFSHVSV